MVLFAKVAINWGLFGPSRLLTLPRQLRRQLSGFRRGRQMVFPLVFLLWGWEVQNSDYGTKKDSLPLNLSPFGDGEEEGRLGDQL